ncbi:MAG: hypothetical protein QXW74_06600 [Archaeoglobaceae archaeon]
MVEMSKLEIELPKRLAEWLIEFSNTLKMTPGQLLANILEYYYEAWKIGYEQSADLRPQPHIKKEEVQETDIVTKLQALLDNRWRKKDKYLLDKFVAWIRENKLEIDEESAEKFLENYMSGKSIKHSTISKYKYILKKFVKFVKEQNQQVT